MSKVSLDPKDWGDFRLKAHQLLDQTIDKMENSRQGRAWTPLTEAGKAALSSEVPVVGVGSEALVQKLSELLPYGVGNTHPRFFGWVHGSGNPGGILAEMVGAAINANLGGRDHGAIYVEKQVINWCRQMMGFPGNSSGLIVSGTSMATIIALKVARDKCCNYDCRQQGNPGQKLVGYASEQAHSCLSRAFDLLGLGSDSLRKVSCNPNFEMNIDALQRMIDQDRQKGLVPFVVIGTVGSVNVGAIDDIDGLSDLAKREQLWLHVDGAFGATAVLSEEIRERLGGFSKVDSLAFDFHKWLHVNYAAGCVLIRSQKDHLNSFAGRAEYLMDSDDGLAAGGPWPVDFGPELSRGFLALKVWAHFLEHGTEKLGRAITVNCLQAKYLGEKVQSLPQLELLAPVSLNIVCFRYVSKRVKNADNLNRFIVSALQNSGLAVPSTTVLNGQLAIRVNITNHRTEYGDLDILIDEVIKIGDQFMA